MRCRHSTSLIQKIYFNTTYPSSKKEEIRFSKKDYQPISLISNFLLSKSVKKHKRGSILLPPFQARRKLPNKDESRLQYRRVVVQFKQKER